MDEQDGGHCQAAAPEAALFEAIVASAMDAIIAVDSQSNIILFNPAAEAMFGVEARVMLGQPLDRLMPERFRTAHRSHVTTFAGSAEGHRRSGALGAVMGLRADGEEFPLDANIARTIVNGRPIATVILREAAGEATDETALLAREVDHRAKNILAIVASIISLTTAPSEADYAEALTGRVAALARANALLSLKRWQGAPLATLVRDELRAQMPDGHFVIEGPDTLLSSRAVQPLGMLFHELATNAARHGALARPGGTVTVRWMDAPDGGLHLSWRETGDGAVTEPGREALGLTLIRRIAEEQLGATSRITWAAEGLLFEAQFRETLRDCRRPRHTPAPAPGTMRDAYKAAADERSADPVQDEPCGTLLIVEDEPILAMQLSRALSGFGWTVLGVAGSVDTAERLLAETPRPDVAILDVDLGGVPVFPFARALRRAGIPFLFCTGFEDVGYNREFSGCTIVRKPATALQILAALRRTVREAGRLSNNGTESIGL